MILELKTLLSMLTALTRVFLPEFVSASLGLAGVNFQLNIRFHRHRCRSDHSVWPGLPSSVSFHSDLKGIIEIINFFWFIYNFNLKKYKRKSDRTTVSCFVMFWRPDDLGDGRGVIVLGWSKQWCSVLQLFCSTAERGRQSRPGPALTAVVATPRALTGPV